jgi:hypothetical protein
VCLGAVLAVLSACTHPQTVERAYDGRVVWGRYVDADAYAAFLRGSIAEASGDPKAALDAYQEVARLDGSGPEVWTRIAALRCAIDRRDVRADEALTRALKLDAGYGPAWVAKVNCALLRGDEPGATAAMARAAQLDDGRQGADRAALLPSPVAGSTSRAQTRDMLMSLVLTAGDRAEAWEALAAWARTHGDVALWSRALESLVRRAPDKRGEVAKAAEELAGEGEAAAARSIASAAASAGLEPFAIAQWPLAARLAVDDAIARGDANRVRSRATRVRVGLDEAAARALLGGRRPLARELASTMAQADPSATGARLAFAAAREGDVLGVVVESPPDDAPVPAAIVVAFGRALVRLSSPERARSLVARVSTAPVVDGDDLVGRPAVELAAKGVFDPRLLSADGRVELDAMRTGGDGAAAAGTSVEEAGPLDLRHEYLALAAGRPNDARTRELGERLSSVASSDPIVAAASALARLGGAPIEPGAAGALMDIRPADPLLASVALRLALKKGDDAAALRARNTLSALGGL